MLHEKYSLIYTELYCFAKSLGLRVLHRRLEEDGGRFHENKTLVIDAELKNTREGLAIIAHEISHYLDKVDGKYPNFYKSAKQEFNKENFREVVNAELSASRRAKRMLKKYGLIIQFEDLNNPKRFYHYWKKNYFC